MSNDTRPNCSACLFAERTSQVNNFVCVRNPPTPIALPQQSVVADGSPGMQIGITSFFPSVTNKNWCGEYDPIDADEIEDEDEDDIDSVISEGD